MTVSSPAIAPSMSVIMPVGMAGVVHPATPAKYAVLSAALGYEAMVVPPPYAIVSSMSPWIWSTLSGAGASQSAGLENDAPARLTIAAMRSDASHASLYDMKPPFEWPTK